MRGLRGRWRGSRWVVEGQGGEREGVERRGAGTRRSAVEL